jgi:hypothetical protein
MLPSVAEHEATVGYCGCGLVLLRRAIAPAVMLRADNATFHYKCNL